MTTEGVVREFLSRQRRMYEGGPMEPVAALLAEDVVWHVPGDNAIAGDHRGREAVLEYFARRRELAGGELRITEHASVAHDDVFVQIADGSAVLGGQQRTWRTAGLYRVAADRIAEAWLVPADLAEFDRAWRR